MAAGLLSLGFVLTGLWVVRGNSRPGWRPGSLPMLLLTAGLAGGIFGCLWGRTPPPAPPIKTKAEVLRMDEYGHLSGEALLEVDDKTDRTEVAIDREVLRALLEQAPPPPPETPEARP